MKKKIYTVQDVMQHDFMYFVDYDYDRSGCRCDPDEYICRCTSIYNAHVEDARLNDVSKEIAEMLGQDEIGHYCINRILTACRMYESDKWYVATCGGYYGDEIESVTIDNKELENWLEILVQCDTDIKKIKVALNCEYGHLLDSVKDKVEVSIETVSTKDIIAPQREYYVKLNNEILKHYEKFEIPRALVIESDGIYKLIDGYHRFSACKDDVCKVVVLR